MDQASGEFAFLDPNKWLIFINILFSIYFCKKTKSTMQITTF